MIYHRKITFENKTARALFNVKKKMQIYVTFLICAQG